MNTESENDQLQTLVASAMLSGILMCTQQGMTVNKAMRVVVVEYLQREFGPDVWKELGVATRTVERWRSEARDSLGNADIPEEPTSEVLEIFTRLVGGKK